ncbi:MAG: putative bifunctional diguanylate cyclase/phosphodiesterase [Leptothrix sp. (in: b-proteobacteria)]
MADLHRLLTKQLVRATRPDRSVDLDMLCQMVSLSYQEEERDRKRIDRANLLMAEEIDAAHRHLERLIETLQVQNTRFEAALENMSQGLCMFDKDRRMVVCNRRYLDMFKLQGVDLVGQSLAEVTRHGCCALSAGAEGDCLASEAYLTLALSPTRGMLQHDCPDGRVFIIAHEPLPDGGFVHTFDDITAWRAANAKMARMASHDALTDLPNRLLLRERLDFALTHRASGHSCALLCLDLDRFKAVNDSLGHPAGDALLQQVTQRLRQLVRGTDTVARLGGDEFAILLDNLSPSTKVEELAERLVSAIEQPFDLDGQTANIGVSIGIAIAPRDGNDSLALIKAADLALYDAKAAGRGCFSFFDAGMDTAAQGRRRLEIDLRRALKEDEFQLYYQPLMNVGAQNVSGFEALLRWNCPRRGMVQPDVFIPMAEELGLIVPMGDWVLRRACLDAMQWPGELMLAVNVSAKQFLQGGALIESVQAALRVSGLPAERLELEITETVLMDNTHATIDTLYRLRELGVHIVMDDFGIGYSSLAYLRSFPFDKVKIDKSFVQEIEHKSDAMAIVRAVSGLCSSLGIASTAEGVETSEQLRLVTAEDCTEVQGYLFSRPIPGADIPRLLERLALPLPVTPALPQPLTPLPNSAHIERRSTRRVAAKPSECAPDVQPQPLQQPH